MAYKLVFDFEIDICISIYHVSALSLHIESIYQLYDVWLLTIVTGALKYRNCEVGDKIMSALVFLSAAFAQALASTFHSSQERPVKIMITLSCLPLCTDAYILNLILVAELWMLFLHWKQYVTFLLS